MVILTSWFCIYTWQFYVMGLHKSKWIWILIKIRQIIRFPDSYSNSSLKDKDTGLRLRKRPIPAPRASTGRVSVSFTMSPFTTRLIVLEPTNVSSFLTLQATDSMYSLADNLTDEWAGSESSHSHSSSIDNTAQYIEVSHTWVILHVTLSWHFALVVYHLFVTVTCPLL